MKGIFIRILVLVGLFSFLFLNGCATLKDSIILGASTGAAFGGGAGLAVHGNKTETALGGALIGAVIGGAAAYFIHGALDERDDSVRHDTLMNLEHYDVIGGQRSTIKPISTSPRKCFTTKVVDNRLVSVPCDLVMDSSEVFN